MNRPGEAGDGLERASISCAGRLCASTAGLEPGQDSACGRVEATEAEGVKKMGVEVVQGDQKHPKTRQKWFF
ncbi:hypothetical protein BS47DRAFT_1351716, partial [Hydnum rufescens UP504]